MRAALGLVVLGASALVEAFASADGDTDVSRLASIVTYSARRCAASLTVPCLLTRWIARCSGTVGDSCSGAAAQGGVLHVHRHLHLLVRLNPHTRSCSTAPSQSTDSTRGHSLPSICSPQTDTTVFPTCCTYATSAGVATSWRRHLHPRLVPDNLRTDRGCRRRRACVRVHSAA